MTTPSPLTTPLALLAPTVARAFSPVSVGNFIAGFDVLGAAVQPVDGTLLGDIVTADTGGAPGPELTVGGSYAHALPANPNENIVLACQRAYAARLEQRGCEALPVRLHLEKRLPVGSGLGSSGSSIVATLVALNAVHGNTLGEVDLLDLAGTMEGRISGDVHYDNVAPSLLGGLQLLLPDGEHPSQRLPFFDDWRLVLYFPGFVVSTRAAREILPGSWRLSQLTRFGARLAGLVRGLYEGDRQAVARLLVDDLVEPHRAPLVPGFAAARAAALAAGALAAGLSGSGPTTVAITPDDNTAEGVLAAIAAAFEPHPGSFGHICRVEPRGAHCLDT